MTKKLKKKDRKKEKMINRISDFVNEFSELSNKNNDIGMMFEICIAATKAGRELSEQPEPKTLVNPVLMVLDEKKPIAEVQLVFETDASKWFISDIVGGKH